MMEKDANTGVVDVIEIHKAQESVSESLEEQPQIDSEINQPVDQSEIQIEYKRGEVVNKASESPSLGDAPAEDSLASIEEQLHDRESQIVTLKADVERLESMLESFREESALQQSEIRRLQAQKRKSFVMGSSPLLPLSQSPPPPPLLEVEEEEAEGESVADKEAVISMAKELNNDEERLTITETDPTLSDVSAKLSLFLKLFGNSNESKGDDQQQVIASQLRLHCINAMVSVHHTASMVLASTSTSKTSSSSSSQLAKQAFNYAMLFLQQLDGRRSSSSTQSLELSYPQSWLLSLFPFNDNNAITSNTGNDANPTSKETRRAQGGGGGGGGGQKQVDEKRGDDDDDNNADLLWLPLHLALSVDVQQMHPSFVETYLDDLNTLLNYYGPMAFDEDVSPLSVAVGSGYASLAVTQAVLDHRPEAISNVDEDGSVPFMHACGSNTDTSVVEYLYDLYPQAIQLQDNFGCGAVHYAAFSGTTEVLNYLLMKAPECASLVEGNGALPLHDAVQNARTNHSSEMIDALLQVNPHAVRKRDDFGAFPLHRAAKSAPIIVLQTIHLAFPQAIYAVDGEGLLPMHYYSQRPDKDDHMDVLKYLLDANPTSKIIHDEAALLAYTTHNGSTGTAGGWRSALSWATKWGSNSSSSSSSNSSSANASSSSATAGSSASSSSSASKGGGGKSHQRRKSVLPVQSGLHKRVNC